ncbi:MAG TPA: glycosyltransferase family 4 protein [Sphingomonas sp.]|uniref:glycosyltransferase family 4 protein n=1 Tax=Sphingomonas sp. TaxID=28214 RepID=UPI002B7B76D9|nr:glycosyltransferase family 4 protein [Sphingomonas sp.]HMI18994.1 glycosyltransferase family 4 protein [Sphingomonas sp.]
MMTGSAGVTRIKRIALIGNSPPRLCGLATFTRDVYQALHVSFPEIGIDLYAMNDPGGSYAYGPEVSCTIAQEDLNDYRAAAQRINDSRADVVLVQHEYGIFGGPAGAMLLRLLDRVDAPVVVTLHTVLEQPNADQRAVIEALARRAAKLIVMAEKGRELLVRVHGISWNQIAVVPHGVPDRPFVKPENVHQRFGFGGRRVLLTFGLLSPNKGIETMIRAMPAIVAAHPESLYVVLGATHPHLVAREGETYRESLKALAEELGVAQAVRFIDGFLDQEALLDYLEAADIYVTPYLNETQITSGTLAYAVALGKPVVSTPYWHAVELLGAVGGVVVPFGESRRFSEEIITLLDDPARLADMANRAYSAGRSMVWSALAESYLALCEEAVRKRPVRIQRVRTIDRVAARPRLEAMQRMTDATGMIQHSNYAVPDRNHGYCVDDNCRALMLMHRFDGDDEVRADQLATIYGAFVQHAWNGELGRFRNFMGFDRQWLEAEGSEDSFGRSLWAIGATAAESRNPNMRRWALNLFDQVAPHSLSLSSLRTWAFALLGADAVLRQHRDHPVAWTLVRDFGGCLLAELRRERRDGWTWFEPVLAYDNARLPEALMRAGELLGDEAMMEEGLAALAWLDAKQTNGDGQFRAVGTDSFGRAYADPLPFDQQPLEAWATVDAMLFAHQVTRDTRWLDAAWRAHGWYLGENDLSLPIATVADGGCYDGLMSDRVNLNQGAESILAFQFVCTAMTKALANAGTTPAQIRTGLVR